MRKDLFFSVFLCLYVGMIIMGGAVVSDGFNAPIKPPSYATSSFGEYREGRFHMGVDYRAVVGTPVYAVDDGYVVRIRCGPWGYGRAIYVSFRGGFMGVYAHLDRFAEPYQSYLYQIQHKMKSYSVDIPLEGNQFIVKRGQILGYTGNSGTQHPHLHFELRDRDGITCLNPRDFGFDWIDDNPPKIESILVTPGDVHSSVNGRHIPAEVPITQSLMEVKITARGNIGFGIDVCDPESQGCRLGPYRISMKVDGEEFCVINQSKLDYATNSAGEVAFYPFLRNRNYWVLWRWENNKSPNYCLPMSGFFSVGEGGKFFEILVEDFYRKVSKIGVQVVSESMGSERNVDITLSESHRTSGVYVHYLYNFVVFEIVLPLGIDGVKHPDVEVFDSSRSIVREIDVFKVSDSIFEAPWEPQSSGKFFVKIEHPKIGKWEREIYTLRRGDMIPPVAIGSFKISFLSESPYNWLYFTLSEFSLVTQVKGMRTLSNVVSIEPDYIPVDEPFELEYTFLKKPDEIRRVGLYRDSDKGWQRVGDATVKEGKLLAKVSAFGRYAVMADDMPPKIFDISIKDGESFDTSRPEIFCKVSDIGSGIASANMYCDDEWLLGEYDGPRGVLRWARDVELTPGRHIITFEVIDHAGFVTKERRSIIIQVGKKIN